MNYTENSNISGLLMLIDFEKAFDSISWNFMFKVLENLGFGQEFIQWIKILNNNFFGSVVQAGVKSDFFKIERGCKQGDPIAAYLFILCTQIMTYMILQNKEIKGLSISDHEIKLCQFADDTTLILDGSTSSLQASLNTIEIFGSFSGLKMNTTKTKLVWIGRKKHSKDKLAVRSKLEWETTTFNLLGLHFSVNLEEMPSMNYTHALEKSKKLLSNWNKRFLTPFGKVTVIKTFILSQFVHLFSNIPSPSQDFINNLNKMLYGFIWANKPDKIKRLYLMQDYQDGGLRMVNVDNFIHSLKLTWLYRIIKDEQSPFKILFEKSISSIAKLVKFGSDWPKSLIKKSKNTFWNKYFLD